jgi:hypothetical protein
MLANNSREASTLHSNCGIFRKEPTIQVLDQLVKTHRVHALVEPNNVLQQGSIQAIIRSEESNDDFSGFRAFTALNDARETRLAVVIENRTAQVTHQEP